MVTCVLLAELVLFIFIAMYHEQGQVLVKQHLVSQMKKYNHVYPSQYERAYRLYSKHGKIIKFIISCLFIHV